MGILVSAVWSGPVGPGGMTERMTEAACCGAQLSRLPAHPSSQFPRTPAESIGGGQLWREVNSVAGWIRVVRGGSHERAVRCDGVLRPVRQDRVGSAPGTRSGPATRWALWSVGRRVLTIRRSWGSRASTDAMQVGGHRGGARLAARGCRSHKRTSGVARIDVHDPKWITG